MSERSNKWQGAEAFEAAARAQAEGLGLMAWLGAALLDHTARTGSELASFARDEWHRDAETLGRLVTCRDADTALRLQRDYLGTKLAACGEEADKLARMTAETCDVTRARMKEAQGQGGPDTF